MKLKELSIEEQIDFLTRKVIINSIIYYDYNRNIMSDKNYDLTMRQLDDIIKCNKDKLNKCFYGCILNDFTADTGFDLISKVETNISLEHANYLKHLALYCLKGSGWF